MRRKKNRHSAADDTRIASQTIVTGSDQRTAVSSLGKFAACLAVALVVALLARSTELDAAGRRSLFVLVLAAGLWMTEAIPAFSVAFLIMALQIFLLGWPGGVFAKNPGDWEMFVRPFASPLIWLFFGGFTLSAAASRTGLDSWMSARLLRAVGPSPARVLFAVMALTFAFSMFMSNTATATMMVALIVPVAGMLGRDDPFRKALYLAIPFAANLGGMATLIGSPPNAIAVGLLEGDASVGFMDWMLLGLPPALVLLVVIWGFLLIRYRSTTGAVPVEHLQQTPAEPYATTHRGVVIFVVLATIALWMTSGLHGVPTPVVSFLPICMLTATGILRERDIRGIPWDVLVLLAGGLSLGVGVKETGLADWIVSSLPVDTLGAMPLAFALGYLTMILSNFMSNTAAANVLLPIAVALGAAGGSDASLLAVPAALAASTAMCMPISTPPNAIAFASGALRFRDFMTGGIVAGGLATPACVLWVWVLRG